MKSSTLAKTTEIIAALFILLFVYTATNKLLLHNTFLISLEKSPLIGFASDILSWLIPSVEILISLMLLIPRFRKVGLLASFILMTSFTIYIAYMLITSPYLPCSCGGVINKLSWEGHLWLNIFLMLLAAAPLYLQKRLKFLFE